MRTREGIRLGHSKEGGIGGLSSVGSMLMIVLGTGVRTGERFASISDAKPIWNQEKARAEWWGRRRAKGSVQPQREVKDRIRERRAKLDERDEEIARWRQDKATQS